MIKPNDYVMINLICNSYDLVPSVLSGKKDFYTRKIFFFWSGCLDQKVHCGSEITNKEEMKDLTFC